MTEPANQAPHDPAGTPENRPTPLDLLLDGETPTVAHYRRNHFPYPKVDLGSWRLEVGGAVATPTTLRLADLQALPRRSSRVLLECAGHRRTEFQPPISGVQWGLGALSQAEWAGASLADVLDAAGVGDGAVEVVFHGADRGPFPGVAGEHTFSRSLPLAKALHPDTLLAYQMNGAPLPREHGAPVRVITPGWYAMDSVKWLRAVDVATEPFRGVFQERDYRLRLAGETGIGTRIERMPVHALFASVADGDTLPAGPNEITGIAWGGAGVAAVEVRLDAAPWTPAKIRPAGPYERAVWSLTVDLAPGLTHSLEVRATGVDGETQPAALTWNQRGYVNNRVQRIEVATP